MRELVAFYPYRKDDINYINSMWHFIASEYTVIDYRDLKKGLYIPCFVKAVYLNWIENDLDEIDKKILHQAKIQRSKIIWVFHNKVPHDSRHMEKAISNIKFLIKISTYIVIHSRTSLNYLLNYCPEIKKEKIQYIPHPNYIADYQKYGDIKILLGIKQDDFVFGIYGRVHPYKNIEFLIEAFNTFSDSYHCQLIIAGEAVSLQYAQELKDLCRVNQRIKLCFRHINAIQMQSYLEAVDVMVLPYNLESSMNSGAMIMAFSYAKTVIVPSIAMAEEYSDDLIYKYSYSNATEHVAALEKVMKTAYMNGKENNQEKGRRLRDIVERHNDKELVKRQLLYLIKS